MRAGAIIATPVALAILILVGDLSIGRRQMVEVARAFTITEDPLERLGAFASQGGRLGRVHDHAVVLALPVATHPGGGRRRTPGTADRQVRGDPEEPRSNLVRSTTGTRLGRQTQERFLEQILGRAGVPSGTDEKGIDLRVVGLVCRSHETVRPTRQLTDPRSIELLERVRTFHVTYNAHPVRLFCRD